MGRKLTDEEFLVRAKKIHGSRYYYGGTQYKGGGTPVCIGCELHGIFYQTPETHLAGSGCPKCNGRHIPQDSLGKLEWFVTQARLVHGDIYDYSKANYTKSADKTTLVCKIHGDFLQSPNKHLMGRGCPGCRERRISEAVRSDNPTFIAKATAVHGVYYDYSKVAYVGAKCLLTIICPVHGDFQQSPTHHLSGRGCKLCANNRKGVALRSSTKAFIEKASKIHGKYEYDEVVYTNNNEKVCIRCRKHGRFNQTPSDHLSGRGCSLCRESKGERAIRGVLEELGVEFLTEYRIPDCRYIRPLPFDFALFVLGKLVGLIEYQGSQHYSEQRIAGRSQRAASISFEITRVRDKVKSTYCSSNSIPLLILPFWDMDKLPEIVTCFVSNLTSVGID